MTKNKIKTISQLAHIARKLKKQNKKIVTTNGVFDILHLGHVKCLETAKRLVNGEKSRIGVLAGLESIDYVFLFGEKDPRKWLDKIKPDIHAKAGDYKLNKIIEKDVVQKNGGKIALIPMLKGYSTTSLINKILKAK